jgi:hypothetical protein
LSSNTATSSSSSSSEESFNDLESCRDLNDMTYCENSLFFNTTSSQWEGVDEHPTLYIHIKEAFFDQLVLILVVIEVANLLRLLYIYYQLIFEIIIFNTLVTSS